jgi:hypothetical protein
MGEHHVKDNNENARGTWQSSGSAWYFKPNIRGKEYFEGRWEEGAWLGVQDESDKFIIGRGEGVIETGWNSPR